MGILASGLLITYLLDLLGLREATFIALWLTCFASVVHLLTSCAVFINYSVWHVGLMVTLMLFCGLSGCWASLHFRWLAELSSILPSFVERVLVTALPIVSTTLSAWAFGVISNDLSFLGYQLLAVLSAFYYLLGLPLVPSYRKAADRPFIQSRVEAGVNSVLLCALPGLVHLAIFGSRLFDEGQVVIHDIVLLFSLPIFYLRLLELASFRPLWWTSTSPASSFSSLPSSKGLSLILTPAAIFSVYSFQERIVVRSFGFLVSSHLPAPWDWLLVTVTLYSLLAVGFLISRATSSSSSASSTSPLFLHSVRFGLAGVCLCIGLVMGAPLTVLLVAAATGLTGALFLLTPNLPTLLLSVVCASLWALWFLATRVALVSYDFASFSLSSVINLLACMFALGLVSSGAVVLLANNNKKTNKHSININASSTSSNSTPSKQAAPSTLFGVSLLVYAIGFLVVENTLFSDVNYPMYPSYLVIATSLLGFFITSRLSPKHLGLITPGIAWLLNSVFTAKLSLYLSTGIVAHVALAFQFLAASMINFFPRIRDQPRAPYVLCLLVGASSLFLDFALHDAFAWSLSEQHSTLSFFVTAFLLLWGVHLIPLLVNLPPATRSLAFVRKFTVLLLSCGTFAVFLNVVAGSLLFDSLSANLWLVFPAMLCTGLGSGHLVALVTPSTTLRRLLLNIVAGIALGEVFCSAFTLAPSLPVRLCVALVLGIGFTTVSFILVPVPEAARVVPFIFFAWLAFFPFTLLVSSFVYQDYIGPLRVDNLPLVETLLIALQASLCFAIALIAKIDVGNATALSRPAGQHPHAGQREASLRGSGMSVEWKAGVGNLALVITFALSVVLNIYYLDGSESCIYLLSPLLLLFNRHWFLLDSLSEKNRYFPLVTGIFVLLLSRSVAHLLFDPMIPWSVIVTNFPLLCLTIPTQLLFIGFLITLRPRAGRYWILAAPLNLVTFFFTDLLSIQGLAVTGLLYSILYFVLARQIKTNGQRIL